jgi:hypothetical protein
MKTPRKDYYRKSDIQKEIKKVKVRLTKIEKLFVVNKFLLAHFRKP